MTRAEVLTLTVTLAVSLDTAVSVGGKLDLFFSQNLSRNGDCRTEAFTLTTSLAESLDTDSSVGGKPDLTFKT